MHWYAELMSKVSREQAAANALASVRAPRIVAGEPLTDLLDESIVVIDAEDFERSQKDSRVHDLFERGQALHEELEAKNANF